MNVVGRAVTVTSGLAVVAWAVMLAGYSLGVEHLVAHDAVVGHTAQALPVAVLLFLAAWQVMIGAMMLPATLPVVGAFARVRSGSPRALPGLAVFLAAYFAVWTAFGVAALSGDVGVHELVHRWGGLEQRPAVVTATVLLLAGGYQFLPVKARCLAACRDPATVLGLGSGTALAGDRGTAHQQHTGEAWRPGVRHAIACLGSSWALMLLMFAVATTPCG